jgi:hypothetical protein
VTANPKGKAMKTNSVIVVPGEKGHFKVLHNYIQHGPEYQCEVTAHKEAQDLKQKLGIK